MKKITLELNGTPTAMNVIGTVARINSDGDAENLPTCIVSEKNMINLLKNYGTMHASMQASKISHRLKSEATKNNFNSLDLQNIMVEEMESIQFAVDCGALLLGDDSKIKEFIKE